MQDIDTVTVNFAVEQAKESKKSVSFDSIRKVFHDRENSPFHGVHGKALPCGCINYDTVLSDGSLGLGEWTEECNTCFYDNNEEGAGCA